MIWLVGDKGMLGADIRKGLKSRKIPFFASDIDVDITDMQKINEFISGRAISWIINCAAYTAVDKAEMEQQDAQDLNAKGAKILAKVAKLTGAKLIQFSTDYVFNGEKKSPYGEEDPVSPTSVYGKTKLAGEVEIQKHLDQYYIIRISWLYGIHGQNFVKTMLRLFDEKTELGIINDQIGGPTYTKQLASNIVNLISKSKDLKRINQVKPINQGTRNKYMSPNLPDLPYGIYHYSDEGSISWYDFACQIKECAQQIGLLKKDLKINPITTDMYPLPAKRPKNSSFNKEKVVNLLGFEVKDWKVNLKAYLAETFQTKK